MLWCWMACAIINHSLSLPLSLSLSTSSVNAYAYSIYIYIYYIILRTHPCLLVCGYAGVRPEILLARGNQHYSTLYNHIWVYLSMQNMNLPITNKESRGRWLELILCSWSSPDRRSTAVSPGVGSGCSSENLRKLAASQQNWLVGGLNPSEKYESIMSIGMMRFPIYGKI